MKYIVTINDKEEFEIFIFPNKINHSDMVKNLFKLKDTLFNGDWTRLFRQPISAGFINSDWQCCGNSESLGLVSRPRDDTELLYKQY